MPPGIFPKDVEEGDEEKEAAAADQKEAAATQAAQKKAAPTPGPPLAMPKNTEKPAARKAPLPKEVKAKKTPQH